MLGQPEGWSPGRRSAQAGRGTIGRDRPPMLGGDVITFEDRRGFLLPTQSTSNRCISQTEMDETGYS